MSASLQASVSMLHLSIHRKKGMKLLLIEETHVLLFFRPKSCPTLCNPVDCRLLCPSLSPAVCSHSCPLSWWCHPSLLPPSPFAFKLSQHQSLFQWVNSSHQVARVLELQLQHESFQWMYLLAVQGTPKSSPTPQFKSISSLVLSLLYGPALRSVLDYYKNHSFDYTDLCWQSDVFAF